MFSALEELGEEVDECWKITVSTFLRHISGFLTKCSNDAMAVYLIAAKWIPRSIHPFLNLTRVIYAGFQDADEVDVAEIEEYVQCTRYIPDY